MVIGICAGYAIIDGADCRAVASIAGMAVVIAGAAMGMDIGIFAGYGTADGADVMVIIGAALTAAGAG